MFLVKPILGITIRWDKINTTIETINCAYVREGDVGVVPSKVDELLPREGVLQRLPSGLAGDRPGSSGQSGRGGMYVPVITAVPKAGGG